MCFYLYSPGKNLKLHFVYESITLYSEEYSEIILDLIIENLTSGRNSEVESILLLYPNTFYDKPDLKTQTFRKIGQFENRTYELSNIAHPANEHYSEKVGKNLKLDGDDPNVIIMTERDPNKLSEPLVHEARGSIEGELEFKICSDLDFAEQVMLHILRFSIFQVNFGDVPIATNQKRWLRLYFKPPRTTLFQLGKGSFLSQLDNRQLHYEIMGPKRALKNFQERLETWPFTGRELLSDDIARAAINSLKKNIITEGVELQGTKTSLIDLRLVLRTHHCEVDYILPHQNLSITHPFPMGWSDHGYYYSFRGGERNIPKPTDPKPENDIDDFLLPVCAKTIHSGATGKRKKLKRKPKVRKRVRIRRH